MKEKELSDLLVALTKIRYDSFRIELASEKLAGVVLYTRLVSELMCVNLLHLINNLRETNQLEPLEELEKE